jgi:hypothetical protein
MADPVHSSAEFQRRLAEALEKVSALLAQHAGERELRSIHLQLEALAGWTAGGQKPTQEQKDRLNFGLLASRHLDDLDQPLAQELYALASWVTYW